MTIEEGRLRLTEKDDKILTLPINRFLNSLAEAKGNNAIAIILSGTGSDGTHGCRAIRKAGGLVICQNEATAQFSSMPQNVENSGLADLSMAPEEMPEALLRFATELSTYGEKQASGKKVEELSDVDKLLSLLKSEYSIDFRHYKTGTFGRRVQRRILLTGAKSVRSYLRKIKSSKEEADTLYRDLLVNVTEFFRDKAAFNHLRDHVAPELVRQAEDEIRIWTCGCATGEEAYSLAIIFLEEIEKQGAEIELQIFATDAHATSLEIASAGRYSELAVENIDEELIEKYFRRDKDHWIVNSQVRRKIVFAQHNVLTSAPFTRLDLIACRNLLIYLQSEPQQQVLSLFHFALKKGGRLMLGKSESIGKVAEDFTTESAPNKIFRKVTNKTPSYKGKLSFSDVEPKNSLSVTRATSARSLPRELTAIYDKLLARFMPPGVLVDQNYEIVHAFPGSENYLRMRPGRPTRKLVEVIDPEIAPTLSQALNQSTRKNAVVQFTHAFPDAQDDLNIIVEPLYAQSPRSRDFLVRFEAIEKRDRKRKEAALPGGVEEVKLDQNARNLIQELQEELDDANENLQTTIEELETSNEELQASNEELVASNEELLSSNEELHSVNEEIFTVNAEYQKKIDELTELTDDMENLLLSTGVGVIFLDANLRIRRFTPRITDVFDLMESDVGRSIGSFSQKIDYDNLAEDMESILAGEPELECEKRGVDGNTYLVRLLPYRSKKGAEGVVMTIIDVSGIKRAEDEIRQLSSIVENSIDAIISFDLKGVITSWNEAAEELYGYRRDYAIGKNVANLLIPEEDLRQHSELVALVANGEEVETFETRRYAFDGTLIPVSIQFSPVFTDGKIVGISSIVRNITQQREAMLQLEQSERRQRDLAHVLENVLSSMPDMIIVFGKDGKIQYASPAAQTFIDRFSQNGELPLRLEKELAQVLETGRDYLPIDHRGVRRLEIDSSLHYFLPRIKSMRENDGRISGAVAIIQDITDLRFLDEMKSNLIATVSHELKTPAVSIRLSLGLLKDESFGQLSPQQLEFVDTSQKEIERLIRNLTSLLDITRFEEGKAKLEYSSISPSELAQSVVEETGHAAMEAKVAVEVSQSDALDELKLDRGRIMTAITNLILNAIKYSPPKGKVQLSLDRKDEHLVISVSDNGPGIPQEYRSQVFERFFRIPGHHGKSGTGLGLSIVKNFVDAHNGRVSISDNQPTGAIFTLEIPLEPAPAKDNPTSARKTNA